MAAACSLDDIFRVFTACPNDIKTLILDARQQKHFKRLHVSQAFCVRVSSDGKALVDHSQSKYDVAWSQGAWWGKHVLVYGDAGLKKDHPVVAYLAKENQCKSLRYYREGFDELSAKAPHLCTASVKAGSLKKYPSSIIPGLLYLGDWSHAEAVERLEEINVKRVVTIHNHPENLKLPSKINHLRLELPDVEVADISKYFNQVYTFVEEARQAGHAVLIHCGAGVSRSATLCMMYLMRHHLWPAYKARDYVVERRSLVCINDGFWRCLCALEAPLGVATRSDPNDNAGTAGSSDDDESGGGGPVQICQDAAGEKVKVAVLTPADLKRKHAGADDGGGKRQKTDDAPGNGALYITLAVSKPEGSMGELRVGPVQRHQRVIFGRVPSCDVVLEHLSVSRQHAMITVDATGGVTLTDLGSAHGTKLDDVWIKAQAARSLRVGSVLQFGASTRRYKVAAVSKEGWAEG